jgi:Orange carotenoid protein, N-terminal
MTSAQSQNSTVDRAVETFHSLDVDNQLALFWFIYKEMGSSITPAAPGASTASPEIAEGLFNQVKDMSHEEQLQIQRDLITGADTQTTRQYGSLSDTTKLLFWYLLAQGMDNSTIIPMPENYELSSSAQELLNTIKQMTFEQQMTLFRNYVSPMGAEPSEGAEI